MLAPSPREPERETTDASTAGLTIAPGEAPDLVWRCTACGYQRLSVTRPERCPACHAGATQLVGRTAIEWRFLLRRTAG